MSLTLRYETQELGVGPTKSPFLFISFISFSSLDEVHGVPTEQIEGEPIKAKVRGEALMSLETGLD